jgi:hypothetical protein
MRREGGLTEGHAFDFGVGEGDAQVVEGEHAVEGLDEELDLELWWWIVRSC